MALLERSHSALILRKPPFTGSFVCFFEELSQWPQQKRGTSAGTLVEEGRSSSFSCYLLKLGPLQPFFLDLYFLNHLVNAGVSGLGFFPLTHSMPMCSMP